MKKRSTAPSRPVPHRSTTPARTCLTSLLGWEAVSQADMAALNIVSRQAILYYMKLFGVLFETFVACARTQVPACIKPRVIQIRPHTR